MAVQGGNLVAHRVAVAGESCGDDSPCDPGEAAHRVRMDPSLGVEDVANSELEK